MDEKHEAQKPITISVVLSPESNRRLMASAKASGRTKRVEAMMRMAHHLKHVDEVNENYWEMIAEEKKTE